MLQRKCGYQLLRTKVVQMFSGAGNLVQLQDVFGWSNSAMSHGVWCGELVLTEGQVRDCKNLPKTSILFK